MTIALGKNTIASELLGSIVERIERIRADKKQLGLDEAEVMAEAKAQGLVPAAIRYVVKVRAMKPHDRQESEALRDIYLHAMGMDQEPPLFRAVGLMSVDLNVRDQVIEAMRKFVPPGGEIIVKVDGRAERLWRDKDGEVYNETVAEREPEEKPAKKPRRPAKAPVPDVDDAGAEALGRQAARENRPIIENPFPFGDGRRARFDEGWRRETGGDGMGGDVVDISRRGRPS